ALLELINRVVELFAAMMELPDLRARILVKGEFLGNAALGNIVDELLRAIDLSQDIRALRDEAIDLHLRGTSGKRGRLIRMGQITETPQARDHRKCDDRADKYERMN